MGLLCLQPFQSLLTVRSERDPARGSHTVEWGLPLPLHRLPESATLPRSVTFPKSASSSFSKLFFLYFFRFRSPSTRTLNSATEAPGQRPSITIKELWWMFNSSLDVRGENRVPESHQGRNVSNVMDTLASDHRWQRYAKLLAPASSGTFARLVGFLYFACSPQCKPIPVAQGQENTLIKDC